VAHPVAPAEPVAAGVDEAEEFFAALPPQVDARSSAPEPARPAATPRPAPRAPARPVAAPPTVPPFQPPIEDEAPPLRQTPTVRPAAPAPAQPVVHQTSPAADESETAEIADDSSGREAATQPAAEKKVPGKILWQFPKQIPGQAYSTTPLRGCPVAYGKTQFAACLGKMLVGLDWKGSGLEKIWECEVGGHVPGSPTLGADGLIRVHSGDGWLHCVDQNGFRVWEPVPVGEPLGWAAPIVDLNNLTYVSGYAGGVFRVGPRGEFKNRAFLRTRQKFDSTGLIYRGMLYIGCEDAFLYAIPISEDEGRNGWNQLEDRGRTQWFINSAPALAGDSTIIVAGRDENLYAFHPDGRQAWKLHIPGQMLASPVVGANGDIFVGVSFVRAGHRDKGKLVCIDGDSHRVRWEFEARGPVESTPVVGDDQVVYFGDNAGFIHALRADGQLLWRQQVRSAVRSAGNIVGPNRLVFGLDNGTMVGILCSSGGVSKKGWPKYLAR
jgi:outer membrane protein assembly factor BamB